MRRTLFQWDFIWKDP